MQRSLSSLNITAAYNLLFNASLFVEEGLGYAFAFDKVINTSENSPLVFRPLSPRMDVEMSIIWKNIRYFPNPQKNSCKCSQKINDEYPTKIGKLFLKIYLYNGLLFPASLEIPQ